MDPIESINQVTPVQPLDPHATHAKHAGHAVHTSSSSYAKHETYASGAHAAGSNMGYAQTQQNQHAQRGKGSSPKKSGKTPLVALGITAGLAAVIYGGGVWAFSNICYPNTTIADTDVSLMRRPTAVARVRSSAESYNLKIEGDGFSWAYKPKKPADIIDAEQAVNNVIATNDALAWPVHLFEALQGGEQNISASSSVEKAQIKPEDIELPASFDRKAFSEELRATVDAFNENRTGTFDAAGAYNSDEGTFTLATALSNQKLDPEVMELKALSAISQLAKTVKVDDSCYVPLVEGARKEQLQTALDAANELIGTSVNLKMGGATVATLDGATLAQWMTFDANLKPTLNTDMVTSWVHDLAAAKLDTVGTQRTYTRPDGKQVTVTGGSYGWVSDEAALIKLLQDAVANKQTGDVDVPTKHKAAKFAEAGAPDWDAYVDVDLSEQYARYYDAAGKLLWESHIISGNPNSGHATPQGVYQLNSKGRGITLVGLDEDKDGEPDYKTPVDFWMPFVGNSIGLHDATWQSSAAFSDARAYTWRGSHGCVNLPHAKAQELYNILPAGTCVITHK